MGALLYAVVRVSIHVTGLVLAGRSTIHSSTLGQPIHCVDTRVECTTVQAIAATTIVTIIDRLLFIIKSA